MEVLGRITKALKQSGKTQKELCHYIGISQNAYTNWKSGHMKSYEKYLPQIADFLNVSIYDLLGEPEKEKSPSIEEPSELEVQFMNSFRELTPEQQKEFVLLARAFVESKKGKV